MQKFKKIQLIVVDGGSTDGTLEVIKKYASSIDLWLSEIDGGIYDAMNKGVDRANGEWLIFMNAGDEFQNESALSAAVEATGPLIDVVYSDWIFRDDGLRVGASVPKMNFRHQAVMYRRQLHDIYGNYLIGKGVTISDYIFFLSIKDRTWAYCPQPIALCDRNGVSAKPKHFYQRLAVELIFGERSRFSVACILLAYPLYRFIKIFYKKMRKMAAYK